MKFQLPPLAHAFPAPLALLACGTLEKPNITTVSWFGVACNNPPYISISLKSKRHSFSLIRASSEFSLNLPAPEHLPAIRFCGSKSGKETDKFRELGWHPLPCPPLKEAPMIEECPISLACVVRQFIPLGSHDLFIAEVLSLHCEPKFLKSDGKLNFHSTERLVYLEKQFWRLERVEKSGVE
ncbi:MAG: flavin reductase family protein [bacterium]